jgi:hypothetical protein
VRRGERQVDDRRQRGVQHRSRTPSLRCLHGQPRLVLSALGRLHSTETRGLVRSVRRELHRSSPRGGPSTPRCEKLRRLRMQKIAIRKEKLVAFRAAHAAAPPRAPPRAGSPACTSACTA